MSTDVQTRSEAADEFDDRADGHEIARQIGTGNLMSISGRRGRGTARTTSTG